jgi:hypothetical protein
MNAPESLVESLTCGSVVGGETALAGKVKAFAWARVSTDMQEDRGLSMPQQLREIRAYAEKHEIEIVEEFSEAASAFQREEKRVEFRRMIDRAKTGREVAAILVHDLSRFSRDSARAKVLLRDLHAAGVRVISLNDPVMDPETVAGVYMEAITFAKNEAYSREVAFHTRKGCRANVQTQDPETGWCFKNGGQPLWGYRSERLTRGTDKRGRPEFKSIWVKDETAVSGRPVHEWARHCLLELAGKGATLDQLRDFCNEHGLPGRRKQYWGTSTWNALLQPHVLLEYCGYGVWNVHGKHGRERPASEWVVVPKAHPAIITEEEAKAIAAARRRRHEESRRFDGGCRRSQTSSYLLSGGLFKCGRCGSNMIGFRTSKGHYYVCGSQPYRRGMGCGSGVYVPQEEVEAEVVRGLEGMMAVCLDPKGFTRRFNEELRRLWAESTDHNPQAAEQLKQVEAKIAHIRRAVEDGLGDAQWANGRLHELATERERLGRHAASTRPPQIDAGTVMAYREQVGRLFTHGKPVEKKQLLRKCVEGMKLAPERLEVEITYRVPEPVMNSVVAGAGFEPATFGL